MVLNLCHNYYMQGYVLYWQLFYLEVMDFDSKINISCYTFYELALAASLLHSPFTTDLMPHDHLHDHQLNSPWPQIQKQVR